MAPRGDQKRYMYVGESVLFTTRVGGERKLVVKLITGRGGGGGTGSDEASRLDRDRRCPTQVPAASRRADRIDALVKLGDCAAFPRCYRYELKT